MSSESDNKKRYLEGYEILYTLGKGMSGKVKLGKSQSGASVAIKLIFVDTMTSRSKEHLQREIKAMMDLKHPNIMQLLDVFADTTYTKKNGETRKVVALILELAGSGELFEFIMHTGKFPEPLARTFFLQLVDAMSLCQKRGISHRDLKPENVLLDSHFVLKVADFGLASLAEESPSGLCKTKCGTTSYMAPEVISGGKLYDGNKADVWSSGVILFIMIAGNPPFEQATSSDWWFTACRCGRYDRFWAAHLRTCPDFPPVAQDLLNKIFVEDPAKRLSFEQMKQHPWMKNNDTWSHAKLEAELSKRLARIETVRIAQKKKLDLKKKALASGTNSVIDPFGSNIKRNSLNPKTDLNVPELPLNTMYGALFSAVPIEELFVKLEQALSKCVQATASDADTDISTVTVPCDDAPILTVKIEQAKMKAVFLKRDVELKIKLYNGGDDEKGMILIHVMRIQGDAWQFDSIRKTLISHLREEGALFETDSMESEVASSSTDDFIEMLGGEISGGLSNVSILDNPLSGKVDLF